MPIMIMLNFFFSIGVSFFLYHVQHARNNGAERAER